MTLKLWLLLAAFLLITLSLAVVVNMAKVVETATTASLETATAAHHGLQGDVHPELTFYYYLVILTAGVALACLRAFVQARNIVAVVENDNKQEPSLLQHIHSWLHYEWRVFQLCTTSISKLIEISTVIAINVCLLYYGTTSNADDQTLSSVSARLAIVNIAFSVLLSAKRSFIQRYIFSVNETITWHKWFARVGSVEALYHAMFHLQPHHHHQQQHHKKTVTDVTTTSAMASFVSSMDISVRSVTGIILLFSLSVLIYGSHPFIRKFISYPFFRVTHLLSFFTLIVFGILHNELFLLLYMTVALFWVMDQIQRSEVAEVVGLEILPNQIVKLTCQRPATDIHIVPCQFALLSFNTSWWKSLIYAHPFSISRVEGDKLTFYIKCKGRQTNKVLQTAATWMNATTGIFETVSNNTGLRNGKRGMRIRVSQPLGKPNSRNFPRYEQVCLIAEGMGVTPWLSLLQYYSCRLQYDSQATKMINLIWSIHTIDTYHAFQKELQHYLHLFDSSGITLRLSVYITGHPIDLELQTEALPISKSTSTLGVVFSYSRPHYSKLLSAASANESQANKTSHGLAIGLCAHEATMIHINNLAFRYGWSILQKEKFEF